MDNLYLVVHFTSQVKRSTTRAKGSKLVPKPSNIEIHSQVHARVLAYVNFSRVAFRVSSEYRVIMPQTFRSLPTKKNTPCKPSTHPCTFERSQSVPHTRAPA